MAAQTIDQQELDALLGRALGDISSAYGGVTISIGHKLGLYKAMAGAGPISPRELAARSECDQRYVSEWLNAQAAGGYIKYHPVNATFELTPAQATVLADEESPLFMPNAWQVPASFWFDEDRAIAAFRSGQGIAWGDHDHRLHAGVAAFYRNGYRANLVANWLPTLDGVVEQLQAGITVADVGCGHGHSTVLLAEAFPNSRFVGLDTHPESIAEARQNAVRAGVESRVTFEVASATEYAGRDFGLICFFDCLHDLGNPVAALRHARQALASGGTVFAVEPFASDHLEDNFNVVGRMYYSASITVCSAHAISEGGDIVLGAQAGEARLTEVFRTAGFNHVRRAAATPFNLILEARVS
jgi:SAM-dependent methyltransferase